MTITTNSRTLARYGSPVSEVLFTASAMQAYRNTIARKPPETFALLGGYLDDPFTVTDFRFCPPRKRDGRYDRSGSHVNVDNELMNWIIDEELKPQGKYMVGIWHSHPGGARTPSVGDETRNEGDMVFFRSCLRHDDSPGRNWKYFIAPITTFAPDGSDRIDVWVVTLDADTPSPASYTIAPDGLLAGIPDSSYPRPSRAPEKSVPTGLPVEAILARFELYQTHIHKLANAADAGQSDREKLVECLRRLMYRELDDIAAGTHVLGRYRDVPVPLSPTLLAEGNGTHRDGSPDVGSDLSFGSTGG